MKKKFISVVVPVYNGEEMIAKCIEAILDQDYPKDRYEILVVDNKSRDNTPEIIKHYPVTYVLQDQIQSSYASRNEGIKTAKGEIFAFTDSDCIPQKTWLSEAVKGFNGKNIGCIAGKIKADVPKNYVEEFLASKNTLNQKGTMNSTFLPYPQTANAFYLRDVIEQIGLFEDKWETGGDGDLAWRMQLETPFRIQYVPESVVLHCHRSTLGSMFRQKVKWGIGRTNRYRKYKDRLKGRHIKETWWDFQTMMALLGKALMSYVKNRKLHLTKQEKHRDFMNFLNYTGSKLGELIGSVKNGVYYV